MPDEDAERHEKQQEEAVLRHWRAFLAACKQEEMDDVTFLAGTRGVPQPASAASEVLDLGSLTVTAKEQA